MTTAFISHPDTLLHVMDGQHPESPARISTILAAIKADKLAKKLQFYQAPPATKSQLAGAHTPDYIERIFKLAPSAGLVQLDADTAMGPMSLSATLHASGAAILATNLVLAGKATNAFCATRPPGHHAGRANSAGFCIFNHIAVAVAHALKQPNIHKVAIIDFDVHHGDGTEDIFKNNPNVMLCSTFQHPFYPHRGADTRSNRMINVPLAAKTDGAEYRQAFEREFLPALAQFKPDILFVSAGFDAHREDPLADLVLTGTDYAWISQKLTICADFYSQKRIVCVLEGGYNLDYLAPSVLAFLQPLTKT